MKMADLRIVACGRNDGLDDGFFIDGGRIVFE